MNKSHFGEIDTNCSFDVSLLWMFNRLLRAPGRRPIHLLWFFCLQIQLLNHFTGQNQTLWTFTQKWQRKKCFLNTACDIGHISYLPNEIVCVSCIGPPVLIMYISPPRSIAKQCARDARTLIVLRMWGHWQGGSYVSAYTPERPPTPPHMCCSVNFNAARGILWDPPALSNIDWPFYIDLTIYIWRIESLQAIYNIESANFLQMACWKSYEWKRRSAV